MSGDRPSTGRAQVGHRRDAIVARMNAAVVTSFAEPPHYKPFEVPQPKAADDVTGTMADKALSSARRSIVLPEDADRAKVAAAMNPAMSSWVALRRRVPIQPGQSVLVLGATEIGRA